MMRAAPAGWDGPLNFPALKFVGENSKRTSETSTGNG